MTARSWPGTGHSDGDSMRDAMRQPTQAQHNQSTRRDSGLSCRNMETLLGLIYHCEMIYAPLARGTRYRHPPLPLTLCPSLSLQAARATGTGTDSCAHSL